MASAPDQAREAVATSTRRVGRRFAAVAMAAVSTAVAVAVVGLVLISRHAPGGQAVATSAPSSPPAVPHGRGSGQPDMLHMLTSSVGWAYGADLIAHTANSGIQFMDVTPAGMAGPVASMTVLDDRHVWVIAGSLQHTFTYRTEDGGASWFRYPISAAGGLTFVDGRHGWLQTSHDTADHLARTTTLMRTSDAGRSWTTIHQTTGRIDIQPSVQAGDCSASMPTFTTPLVGMAGISCPTGGTPQMQVTHDGGATWRAFSLPRPAVPSGTVLFAGVGEPTFASANDGAVFVNGCVAEGGLCQEYTAMYHTADGGRSWSSGEVVRGGQGETGLDIGDAWISNGCMVPCATWQPALLRTSDGGATWVARPLPTALGPNLHGNRSFDFVSPSIGFAWASNGSISGTQFYRTNDGGSSFVEFTPTVVSSP